MFFASSISVGAADEEFNLEFRVENYNPHVNGEDSFNKNRVSGSWVQQDKGVGFALEDIAEIDWRRVEGFGFLKIDGAKFSLGCRNDRYGHSEAEYVFPGIGFRRELYGFYCSLAFTNYFSLDSNGESFFDTFAVISRSITPKFSLSGVLVEDHYWNDDLEMSEWFLAGAIARYQYNDHFAFRLRLARSWSFYGRNSEFCDQIRFSTEFHY